MIRLLADSETERQHLLELSWNGSLGTFLDNPYQILNAAGRPIAGGNAVTCVHYNSEGKPSHD